MNKCQEEVRSGDTWRRVARMCGKTAKFERDGKFYCGTHNPAKHEAKIAKWEREWAVKAALELRKSLILKMTQDLTAEQVRQAIEQWKGSNGVQREPSRDSVTSCGQRHITSAGV